MFATGKKFFMNFLINNFKVTYKKMSRYSLRVTQIMVNLWVYFLLLCCCCDHNKIKMARKPGKKQKENPVGCTGEGKR